MLSKKFNRGYFAFFVRFFKKIRVDMKIGLAFLSTCLQRYEICINVKAYALENKKHITSLDFLKFNQRVLMVYIDMR